MALTQRHNAIRTAFNGAANSVAEMSRELEHSRLDTANIRAAMEESERCLAMLEDPSALRHQLQQQELIGEMMGERMGGLRIQTANCLWAKNGQLEKTVADMTEKIRQLESDNMSLREDLSKKSAKWEQKEKDMSAAVQKETTRADEAERDADGKAWVWDQEKKPLETSLDEERMRANSAMDELRRDCIGWEGDRKLLSADISKTKARMSELDKSLREESAARGSLEEKLSAESKSASDHSIAQQAIIDVHLASIDNGKRQLEEMKGDRDGMAASLATATAELETYSSRAKFSATICRKLRERIVILKYGLRSMACMVEILEAENDDLSRVVEEWEIHSRHSRPALNLHIGASWAAGVVATSRYRRLEDVVTRCRLEIEAWEIMELETAAEVDEIKRRLRAYLFATGAVDAVARRTIEKERNQLQTELEESLEDIDGKNVTIANILKMNSTLTVVVASLTRENASLKMPPPRPPHPPPSTPLAPLLPFPKSRHSAVSVA